MVKKLNLGCGTDIREGWTNLDSARIPGVDVVHDVEQIPLPFSAGEFGEILCQDILEHVEYIPLVRDLHRILEKGGVLHIRVPHFTSKNNYTDPTHKRAFSVNTFDFFVRGNRLHERRAYYFDFSFEKVERRKITFERSSRWFFLNRFVEPFINRSRKMQEYYESTFLSRLFPAQNIEITVRK